MAKTGGIKHIKHKTCKVCGIRKPIEEFYKSLKWYQSYCKDCQSAFTKLWRRENKDHIKEYKQKQWARMPKEKKWNRHLIQRYGITVEQYMEILDKQGGLCKICGEPSKRLKLSVDHCHNSKKIRGLLCERCNTLLGRVKDNPVILENAAKYLRNNKGK